MWKRIKGFDERQITRLTVTREQSSSLERMSFVKAFHKPRDLVPRALSFPSSLAPGDGKSFRWCPVFCLYHGVLRNLTDWAVARFQFGRWNSSNKCIAQKGNKWAIEKTDWRRRHHLPLLVARTFFSTSYSWTTKQTIQKLILSMCVLVSSCLAKTFQLNWKLCWRSFWSIF